jgi:hypothetical protein
MDPVFSRPGEAPTAFERQLLDAAAVHHPSTTQELWLLIAQRAGLEALMVVLDEFGNGAVWVPSRRTFFNALGGPTLENMITTLLDQDVSQREIARRMCMSHTQVQRIAARHRGTCAHGTAPATREKQRG